MQCPSCQHPSPDGSRFCESCGAYLTRRCAACGGALSARARFCPACGAAVETGAASGPGGERRQLTVMFCDLVGYTDLAHRVDPEELREILTTYQQACVRAVGQFEGHVAQYLGDGLLVYFGFPQAREDSAERAIRAALAIRSALGALSQRRAEAGAEPVAARIGIHTGEVLLTGIGDDARHETLALGDTVNVAARLQALAGPGEIHVSHTTLRLVPGLFQSRDLGAPPLKGLSERIGVHAIEASAGVVPRFRTSGPLTPLTGRQRELALLIQGYERALDGAGEAMLVTGEPGIGKSRLLHGFRERIAGSPHFALALACSPWTAGSAFQPLVELLERGLDFSEDDDPALRLEKLEDRLTGIPGLALEEVVPYLALLLGLPESERFPLEHTGPELQRERTLEALVAPLVALAHRQPLLVVCEDLHWSDPSTLELLGRLIERAPGLRMLAVMTARPEFKPPWPGGPHVSELALRRLERGDTRSIVRAVAGAARPLPDDVVNLLAERADGVPLFAEELARAASESGAGAESGWLEPADGGAPRRVPTTLQDSLMARLDRLGAGKRVAQVAAALGRTFGHALIEAVAELEPARLELGLAQLVDAGILQRSGEPPRSSYTFRHALIQDTAYHSQLRSRRRELHARIAAVLRERFPQRVVAEPEVIARHFAAAGQPAEAVEHYRQAGDQAAARVAYREAHGYFARALELLATLPEDAARDAREIDLRMAQAAALAALRGYEDPELAASIARTERLCEKLGPGPQRIPGLLKLMVFHTHALPRAREWAKALLAEVEPLGIAPLQVAGYVIRGTGALTSATVSEACADLSRALELAETTGLQTPRAAFEVDAVAMACCTYAMALVLAGKPDTAAAFVERGVARARALGHPRSLASALQNGAMAFHLMDDPERTGALSDQCLELIDGRGFHQVEVSARVLGGWARVCRGELDAIEDMDAALRDAEARGVLAGMTQLCFASAAAHARAGDQAGALAQLARGEAFIERTGEQFGYEPQAVLARAGVLLAGAAPDFAEIERLLRRALALWERNQSPWMALHAATLLGRVARATRSGAREARERIASLLAGLDEGHDRERLREARAELAALAVA